MSGISNTGFTLTRLDERLAELTAAVQTIFGLNINLDPSSVDGQTLGIYAESTNNNDMLAQAVYQSFDPDTATGAALSRLVKLNAINRNLGSYGIVGLVCTGQLNTVIPLGSLITAGDGSSVWATTASVTIDATGSVNVTAQCTTAGAVPAPAGTLTRISSPTYGWQSVSNVADAIEGTNQETDEALRIRRAQSVATAAQGIVESIYGALDNVTGVVALQVYENKSDSADSNGQPPHSIYAVVEGGTVQDILNAIWLKQSGGVTLVGSVTGIVTDSFGNPHLIQFDRPAIINVYISMTIKTKAGIFPTNGVTQIIAAIMVWAAANQSIGDDVVWSELFTPINTIPGVSVQALTVDVVPGPVAFVDLVIPYNALAVFDPARIVITVI